MEKRTKKVRGKTTKGSGTSPQRRATIRDLEATDRDQDSTKGGGIVGVRKSVGKNPPDW